MKVSKIVSILFVMVVLVTSPIVTSATTRQEYLEGLKCFEEDDMGECIYYMRYFGDPTDLEIMQYKFKRWDERINIIYPSIREELSEKRKAQLKDDEVKWIVEKERKAQAILDRGGTQLEYYNYLVNTTKSRCYYLVNTYTSIR